MRLQHIARNISVFLLLGVFFYATSVKDLHYAFSAKHHTVAHTHQCDHHVHSTEKEEDCFICKLDVVSIFNCAEAYYPITVVFPNQDIVSNSEGVKLTSSLYTRYLRGPPYIG